MTLRRLEEAITEVSNLAAEEFCAVIIGKDNEAIFHDSESWLAYMKVERCEELALALRVKLMNRESHILASITDMLDRWECEGFYGMQIYMQKRFAEYWHDLFDAESKLWVARQMLSRIEGYVEFPA